MTVGVLKKLLTTVPDTFDIVFTDDLNQIRLPFNTLTDVDTACIIQNEDLVVLLPMADK